MSHVNISNYQLILYNDDLLKKQREGDIFLLKHKTWVDDLVRNNQKKFKGVIDERNAILKEYYEHDENGNVKNAEDGKPVLTGNLTEEEFQNKMGEFLKKQVTIEV